MAAKIGDGQLSPRKREEWCVCPSLPTRLLKHARAGTPSDACRFPARRHESTVVNGVVPLSLPLAHDSPHLRPHLLKRSGQTTRKFPPPSPARHLVSLASARRWKRAAQMETKADDVHNFAACRPIRRMDSRRWASRAAPSRHSSATSRRSCRYALSTHHRRNPVPPIHIPPTFVPAKGTPACTCSAESGRGPACPRGVTDDEGG